MTDYIHDFRVLSGARSSLPSLAEAREGLSDGQRQALHEARGGAGLPDGVELKRKGDESYWYVKQGAVTLGVVSAHKGGTYDADTDPDGKGKFQGGFKSPMAAAQWVVDNNVPKEEAKPLKDQYKDAKKRAKEYPDSDWGKHARKLKKKMKGESRIEEIRLKPGSVDMGSRELKQAAVDAAALSQGAKELSELLRIAAKSGLDSDAHMEVLRTMETLMKPLKRVKKRFGIK